MKFVFYILLFLFSMEVAAQQIRYEDGSYYNDDYIHPENTMKSRSGLLDNTNPPTMTIQPVEKPVAIVKAKPKKPIRSRGGFQEVQTGGRVGDFQEIGSESENTTHSRGSR